MQFLHLKTSTKWKKKKRNVLLAQLYYVCSYLIEIIVFREIFIYGMKDMKTTSRSETASGIMFESAFVRGRKIVIFIELEKGMIVFLS